MNRKVLILTNYIAGLHWFRRELVERLINERYDVAISAPKDSKSNAENYFLSLGCSLIETNIERRGKNPLKDISLFLNYLKIIHSQKPDVVLTYTIKPNVFGGLACRIMGVPYISNVTGLGTSIENRGLLSKISLFLYKSGLTGAKKVFFQNDSIKDFMVKNNIVKKENATVIPGSGVNTENHFFEDYPDDTNALNFLFIGRIMKDKGVNELLEAAKIIKNEFPETKFHFVGEKEKDYDDSVFDEMVKTGMIIYHGRQEDVHPLIKDCHAIVIPSYHEGMCNVLLEAASTGRPVLASKVPGCMETFDEGVSGLGFQAKSVESLVEAIRKFIEIPYENKKQMGFKGRNKMEKEFDRNIVVKAYMESLFSFSQSFFLKTENK
jgi:glycosyltransferase involved in cell wall biosynthesis